MLSYENEPPSSPNRAPAARPSKSKTITQSAFRDGSPSQSSPTAQGDRTPKGKASGFTIRPSLRETFFDDATPVDNKGNDSSEDRDPHDLSFNPAQATRSSIMDHMLLSFDQFDSPGNSLFDEPQINSFAYESEAYVPTSRYSAAASRSTHSRGNTYGSSFSSELDFDIQDAPGRSSNHGTRGRRSNSSNQYQGHLRRVDSLRGEGERMRVMDSQRSPGKFSRTERLGSKGSKSSGGSLDLSQMLAGTRVPVRERRSSSIDNNGKYGPKVGMTEGSQGFIGTSSLSPMLESELSPYAGADAAPEPTIPAGPRRAVSPSSTRAVHNQSLQPSQEPPVPTIARRGSAKSKHSTKSGKVAQPSRKTKDALGTSIIKKKGTDVDQNRELPPLPPVDMRTVSASSVPRSQSNTNSIPFSNSAADVAAPAKERPGFFRKFFGSSRNSPVLTPEQVAELNQPTSDGVQSTDQHQVSGSARAKLPRESSKECVPQATASASKDAAHTITKKPSSFFRRRKKSVSESAPPLPTTPIRSPQNIQRPEASPIDSFSKGFESYLSGNRPASQQQSRQATATTDSPLRTNQVQTENISYLDHSATLNQNLAVPDSHDDSFLADSSGNEDNTDDSPGPRKIKTGNLPGSQSMTGVRAAQGAASTTSSEASMATPKHRPGSKGIDTPTANLTIDTNKAAQFSPRKGASDVGAVFLDSASSEDEASKSHLRDKVSPGPSPNDPAASNSDVSRYHTANNTPIVQSQSAFPSDSAPAITVGDHEESDEPTAADKDVAQKIFNHEGGDVKEADACAWLGDADPQRSRVRKAYLSLFEWSGLNILAALRGLCDRLVLRAESQQVDRILVAFATRWCECNPNHGFKATDVVHTICYSVLLLNTDLHLADIDSKMTRGQFLRNAVPTIRRVVLDAAPDAFETGRVGTFTSKSRSSYVEPPSPASKTNFEATEGRASIDTEQPRKPLMRQADKLREGLSNRGSGMFDSDSVTNLAGPLVNTPFTGPLRVWETQIEIVLKEFYTSISKQRLPLHGSPERDTRNDPPPQMVTLLGLTNNVLRRSPSTISKANSEAASFRGRHIDHRLGTGRWQSKTRSRAKLYNSSTVGSSRTSFDDQSSVITPSISSTWSKHSMGKTLTSMSVDSFGSEHPRGDYQQSIGFANALSQAIIREESAASGEETLRMAPLLDDESLAIAGAPWAKEGILKHKHHLDSVDKRSKDRNWGECFAVIEKGWMRLFSFNMNAKTIRAKAKRQGAGQVVGGGNWMDNAEEIWKFLLRQTIASALPPPGYSKSRPHVWALSLPTGAVHLFQVGTPEIVKEFVTTANYWSARLSKEPLIGGVSNMEYGWSDSVINTALVGLDESRPPPVGAGPRPSIQSSIRGSLDQQIRPRLPGDRVHINDWTPPQQSMAASALMEVDQLRGLQTYVKNVEDELQKHNELRSPMLLAFSTRHPNSGRAMTNWERKSSYLLREIVKFRTYIDCLHAAQASKEKIYAERAVREHENEDDFIYDDDKAKTGLDAEEEDVGDDTIIA